MSGSSTNASSGPVCILYVNFEAQVWLDKLINLLDAILFLRIFILRDAQESQIESTLVALSIVEQALEGVNSSLLCSSGGLLEVDFFL